MHDVWLVKESTLTLTLENDIITQKGHLGYIDHANQQFAKK